MTSRGPGKRKKKAEAAPPPPAAAEILDTVILAAPPAAPAGPGRLPRARVGWEHGEWQALLELDDAALATDPDRAKLALILAAAHSHAGRMERATELAWQAQAWGASREIIARVLLSAAQNSLGRVAAALDEDALPQFEAALRLVQPQADVALLARNRRMRELAGMGLLPDAAAVLEQELGVLRANPATRQEETLTLPQGQLGILRQALARTLPDSARQPEQSSGGATTPCEKSLHIYQGLSPARQKNFVYLDVKSLPRAGVHFMRNSFESLLRDSFSFCEWYTEPGCCRKMPCAATGYASERQDMPLLRMIKSHDFDLTDPAHELGGVMYRLVLLRDPLYLLTSWWSLQVLYFNADLLQSHGITKTKINFAHQPHVVDAAYRIIDQQDSDLRPEALQDWLRQKTPYILGFVGKWAEVTKAQPQSVQFVQYDDTPEAVLRILDLMKPQLPADAITRIEAFRDGRDKTFKARQDPFISKSGRLAEFLQQEAAIFRETAEALCRQDSTGLLAAASTPPS